MDIMALPPSKQPKVTDISADGLIVFSHGLYVFLTSSLSFFRRVQIDGQGNHECFPRGGETHEKTSEKIT